MNLNFLDRLPELLESFKDWIARRWSHIVVPIVLSFGVAVFVENPFEAELPDYKIGDIAAFDLKAPARIIVVEPDLTRARQDAAERDVPLVFDYDSQVRQSLLSRIRIAFDSGRRRQLGKTEFENLTRHQVTPQEWETLTQERFRPKVEMALIVLMDNFYRNHFLTEEVIEIPGNTREFVIRDLFSEIEERISAGRFQDRLVIRAQLAERLDGILQSSHRAFSDLGRTGRELVQSLAEKFIESNLTYNQVETQKRRQSARDKIEDVVVEIQKGEMIVREGQRLDRSHMLLLENLKSQQDLRADFTQFIGFTALVFSLIFILHWVGIRNFRKFRFSTKDRVVLGSYFLLSIALLAALGFLTDAAQSHESGGIFLRGLLPLAFIGMTLRLFTSMEICTFFSILFAVCLGWLFKDPFLAVVFLSSSLAGAAAMRHINQRVDVVKAGLFAGAVQCSLILLGVILGLSPSAGFSNIWVDLGMTALFAFASGLLSASIVLVSQPLIEYLGYTTDLRLMELSNTNHPLLRELIMNAPGSYYHSFVVSQLAEKAAQAINANPLFARVASLYHDVGKLTKPNYFIENIHGENKHDKLVPSMSALIISNHVKDGIELAYRHKLPQSIVEVIPQHHGTALISYFYEKAKQAAGEDLEIDEKEFRYPGPKPQTKEAAIIMCADAVEATVKSLGNVSVDQLRQKVSTTIRRFFLDGQLDECDLSLKDLNGIGNAFVNVLQGIYHQRIEYPHLKDQEKKVIEEDPNTRSITSKSIGSS